MDHMDIPSLFAPAAAPVSRFVVRASFLLVLAAATGCGPREILVAVPGRLAVTKVVRAELAERGTGDVQLVEDIGRMPRGRLGEIEYATRLAGAPAFTVVVGPGDSRTALMTAPVYNAGRLPQIVPTATNGMLRQAGPWTFLLAPSDSLEGEFIADFAARTLGARRVTIFFLNDEYGVGLRDALVRSLSARGVAIIDQVFHGTVPCPGGRPDDFEVLVPASLARGRPDAVIVAGRDYDAACLLRHFHARAPGLRFVLGDGVEMTGDFRRLAGAAAESAYAVAFWDPAAADSASRAFTARFRSAVGRDPTPGEGLQYDALWLALGAARRSRGDRARARRSLEELGFDAASLRAAAGSGVRSSRILMMRMQNGRRRQVAAW